MGLLDRGELGFLAAQATLGPSGGHTFAGAGPDEVGLELCDHGQDVEQESAYRVGRVADRPAEVEPDLTAIPGNDAEQWACSSRMSRASVTERARRSSLATTSVSPDLHAAMASRSPGRERFVPVSPWST